MRTELRITGFGGQGIILAGYIVGKAASVYDGKFATMVQAYGPEARGGASNADVIISDDPIDYPLVAHPDHFVAMFQEAYERYRSALVEGGVLLIEALHRDSLVDIQSAQGSVLLWHNQGDTNEGEGVQFFDALSILEPGINPKVCTQECLLTL